MNAFPPSSLFFDTLPFSLPFLLLLFSTIPIISTMSDENEMIIVDDESPPPLDDLALDELPPPLSSSLSPSTPVPIQSSRSKIAELVSKMTRKHRKSKRRPGDGMSELEEDDDGDEDESDEELDTSSSNSSSDGNMTDDVNSIDTDDLLEEADELPPLRNKKVIVSTRRVVAMLNKTREKKLRALKQAKTKAKKRDNEVWWMSPTSNAYLLNFQIWFISSSQHCYYDPLHAGRESKITNMIQLPFKNLPTSIQIHIGNFTLIENSRWWM